MNVTQIVVRGTLKPDGTLELAEKPALPAGPVEVVIRQVPTTPPEVENGWQHLQRMRAEMEALGYPFMTDEEVARYVDELRSGDERLEEVYRQIEKDRHKRW